MTKADVFAKVREILAEEFELDPEKITLESQLFTELGLDSIDAVDLIVKLKPYIEGKIDPELFKQTRTVGDVVNVLFPLLKQ
ncbi:MAG: phosphopantetheine-binding protein [Treponema sp.]|jgi:acyl carrier protein|nr:phosphopantetheine-binding protein [Treponema sp.]